LFGYTEERFESPELGLTYHLAPWDRPVFQCNTAVLSSISIRAEKTAVGPFGVFRDWCRSNDVKLVSCRLAHDQITECSFLEARGFRFIELNYRPTVVGLERFSRDDAISVCSAGPSDAPEITSFAGKIFGTGRLHSDPQVVPEIGNRRYARWAENAFHNSAQHVLKCVMGGNIIAFMVIEQPRPDSRFWSLVGLAPGLAGRGLGRRVCETMLAFHHSVGVSEVSTSISSHNVAVFNLYVALNFRFPKPMTTLHWCPFGPVKPPAV
jgi:hypothetical protein